MSRIIMENAEGAKLEREMFEYRRLGKTRFIGIDAFRTNEDWGQLWLRRKEFFPVLEELKLNYATSITENCVMKHHNGGKYEDENMEWHCLVGYFLKQTHPFRKDMIIMTCRQKTLHMQFMFVKALNMS